MWNLRAAVPGDEKAVALVHVTAWQQGYRGLIAAEFLDALQPDDWAARYTFDRADPATVVAVDASGRIGGVVTYGRCRDAETNSAGEVLACYVDPSRWRTGIGRLLLTDAVTRLARDGYTEAVLWVLAGNDRAEQFYRREHWHGDGAARTVTIRGITVNENRFRTTAAENPGLRPAPADGD